ncbi:two-component system response regulator FixJ [Oxalobacteraceae bacterium GrIS 2.11]
MKTDNQLLPVVNIIDDDLALLQMMQDLISSLDVTVRTFPSAPQFLDGYHRSQVECLICDIRMPEMSGMELQNLLNERRLDIPLIFISGFAEVEVAVTAMKHGAFDFLEKPFSKQMLLDKIHAALQASRKRLLCQQQTQTRQARLDLLSARERQVVNMVVEGKTSKEIAGTLQVTIRTIESHRTHIYEKLHVNTSVELLKLFL